MGMIGDPHIHFDIVCEECEKRIGGCRCMGSNKTKIKKGLCDNCKNKKPQTPQKSYGPYDCYD